MDQEQQNLLVWKQTAQGPPAFFLPSAFFPSGLFFLGWVASGSEDDVRRRGAGLSALLAGLGSPSCAESPEAGLSGETLLRARLF